MNAVSSSAYAARTELVKAGVGHGQVVERGCVSPNGEAFRAVASLQSRKALRAQGMTTGTPKSWTSQLKPAGEQRRQHSHAETYAHVQAS